MSRPTPSSVGEIPRFCPDCGRAANDRLEGPLCDYCGARLAKQGYCPICEARLRRRVGETCPKHDVELLAEEPAPWPLVPDAASISWVTVQRFPDSLSAAAARIRLDAEGIPTFVEGERMGAPAMYRVATGGVKLQVPAEHAADARVILSQDWSWPGDEPELEEGPEIDEGEPIPPATESAWAFGIEFLVIVALAIPLLVLLLSSLRGR